MKDKKVENLKVNGLVWGIPKSGKTRFVCGWEGPVYVFDFDDGLSTVLGQDVYYDTYKDVSVKQPVAFTNAQRQLAAFADSVNKTGKVMYKDGDAEVEIKTIVIDGATDFVTSAMNYFKYSEGKAGELGNGIDYVFPKEYLIRFINTIKAFPCHFWLVAHPAVEKDRDGAIIKEYPNVPGALKGAIGGKFDIIMQTKVKITGGVKQFKLLTESTALADNGYRFEGAFQPYEEPSYENIMGKIEKFVSSRTGETNTTKEDK